MTKQGIVGCGYADGSGDGWVEAEGFVDDGVEVGEAVDDSC